MCESHLLRLLEFPPIGLPQIGLTPIWTNFILTTRMGVDQLFRDRENVTIHLETRQLLKVGPPQMGVVQLGVVQGSVQMGVVDPSPLICLPKILLNFLARPFYISFD